MQSRSLSAPPSGTNDTLVSPDRRRYRFRSGSGGGHGVFDLPPPGAEGKAVVHLSRVARARRAKGVRVVSQRTRSLRPEISRSSSSSASSSSLLSLSSAKSILKQRSQPSETEAAVVPASVAVVSVLQSVGQRPPSPQRLAGSAGPRRSLSMPQGNAKANSTTLAMGRGGREGKDVGLNLSQCDVNSDVFVTASSQELEEQVAMAESERKKEITTTMAIKTVMAGTGTMAENKRVRWLSPVSGSKTLLKATPKTHTSPRTSSSSSSTIDRDHASDVRADDDSDLGHEITHLPLPASTDDDIIPICSQGRYWTSHHQRRGSFVPEYAAKGARPPPPSPASSSASPVPWRKYAGQRSGDFGTVPTRAAGTAGKGEKGKTGRESRRRWYAVPPRLYGPPSTGLKKDSQRREQQPPPTEKGLSPAQRYLIEHLTSGSLHPEVEKYLNWLQSSSPTKISNSRGDGGESLTSSMRRLLLPRQKQGGETVLHPEVEKYLNWLQACPTTTQPPVETASDYSAPAEAGEAETSHGGHRGPGADAMPRHRVANNTDPKAARPINQKRSSLAWGWTAPEPKDDGPSPPGTVPKQIRKSALKKKHVTLASVPVSRATSPSSPTFRRSRGRSVPPASDRLTHRQQRPNHTQPPTAKEDGTSGAFTAEDVRSISPEWHVPGCVQPAARCRDSTHQVPRRAATDVKSTRGLAQPRPLKHSDNLPLGASSSRSIPDERRRARWLSLLEELHFSDKRQVVRDMATSRAHAAAASKSSSAPATPTMRAFVVDERELLALRERCGSSESADSDDTFVLPPASSSRASVVDCGVGTSDHTLNGDFQVTHKDHQDRRENRETTHSSSSVATSRDQQDSGVSFPTRTRRELFKALSSGKPRLFNRGIPSLSLKRKGGEEDETIKGSRIDGPFFDGRGGVHRGYWSPGRSTPAATALQGNDSRRFPDSALADFYPFEGGSKDGMSRWKSQLIPRALGRLAKSLRHHPRKTEQTPPDTLISDTDLHRHVPRKIRKRLSVSRENRCSDPTLVTHECRSSNAITPRSASSRLLARETGATNPHNHPPQRPTSGSRSTHPTPFSQLSTTSSRTSASSTTAWMQMEICNHHRRALSENYSGAKRDDNGTGSFLPSHFGFPGHAARKSLSRCRSPLSETAVSSPRSASLSTRSLNRCLDVSRRRFRTLTDATRDTGKYQGEFRPHRNQSDMRELEQRRHVWQDVLHRRQYSWDRPHHVEVQSVEEGSVDGEIHLKEPGYPRPYSAMQLPTRRYAIPLIRRPPKFWRRGLFRPTRPLAVWSWAPYGTARYPRTSPRFAGGASGHGRRAGDVTVRMTNTTILTLIRQTWHEVSVGKQGQV